MRWSSTVDTCETEFLSTLDSSNSTTLKRKADFFLSDSIAWETR